MLDLQSQDCFMVNIFSNIDLILIKIVSGTCQGAVLRFTFLIFNFLEDDNAWNFLRTIVNTSQTSDVRVCARLLTRRARVAERTFFITIEPCILISFLVSSPETDIAL